MVASMRFISQSATVVSATAINKLTLKILAKVG